MKKLHLLMVILYAFTGCTSENEKKDEKERNDKINHDAQVVDIYKKLKHSMQDSINSKYSILFKWDTLKYNYTVDYSPVMNSEFQVIDKFKLLDIYEKEGAQYISILTGTYSNNIFDVSETFNKYVHRPKFYFDFPITKDQENIIRQPGVDIILVVHIDKIVKIKLSVGSETTDDEPAYVFLNTSNDFIGRGKIIKIFSLKQPRNKNEEYINSMNKILEGVSDKN